MTDTSNALYILAFVLGIMSGGMLQNSVLLTLSRKISEERVVLFLCVSAATWAVALISGVVLMIRAAISMEYLAAYMFPIGYLIGAVTIYFFIARLLPKFKHTAE